MWPRAVCQREMAIHEALAQSRGHRRVHGLVYGSLHCPATHSSERGRVAFCTTASHGREYHHVRLAASQPDARGWTAPCRGPSTRRVVHPLHGPTVSSRPPRFPSQPAPPPLPGYHLLGKDSPETPSSPSLQRANGLPPKPGSRHCLCCCEGCAGVRGQDTYRSLGRQLISPGVQDNLSHFFRASLARKRLRSGEGKGRWLRTWEGRGWEPLMSGGNVVLASIGSSGSSSRCCAARCEAITMDALKRPSSMTPKIFR